MQNAASFYQASYASPAMYMANDREMSPLWSETLGGKLSYAFNRHVEVEGKLDLFYYHYSDFPALASRTGGNVGLGVALTY